MERKFNLKNAIQNQLHFYDDRIYILYRRV